MYSTQNIIIQNGSIIPLSEEYNKYIFQDCKDKWITKDGKTIDVKDMSTKHIENSIAMIDRICELEEFTANNYSIYRILCEELKRR